MTAELIGWISRANDAHTWSHNYHYHRWLLRQLPRRVSRSIDVGCGSGNLVRALASRVDQAMGIDIDPETIAIARSRSAGNANVEFHTAALTEMASTSYDVVPAIAVVHHLDLSEALTAMRRLTKPGGKLLIVGCYRSATASDYLIDVLAIPANLLTGLLKSRYASSARIGMSARTAPPRTTLGQVRKVVADVLPGARVRRRLFWRLHPQLHGRLNGHSSRRPSDSHRTVTGMCRCPRQPDLWSPQADPATGRARQCQ